MSVTRHMPGAHGVKPAGRIREQREAERLVAVMLRCVQDHRPALRARSVFQHVLSNLVTGHIAGQNPICISQAHAGTILDEGLDTRAAASFHCQVKCGVAISILGVSVKTSHKQ